MRSYKYPELFNNWRLAGVNGLWRKKLLTIEGKKNDFSVLQGAKTKIYRSIVEDGIQEKRKIVLSETYFTPIVLSDLDMAN